MLQVGASMWCGSEMDIIIYDAETSEKLNTLSKHTQPVTLMCSLWGRIICCASSDTQISMWT